MAMKKIKTLNSIIYSLIAIFLVFSTSLSTACAQSQLSSPGASNKLLPYEQNTVNIVKKYKDSVVAINVTVHGKRVNPYKNIPPEMRQFFKQFGFSFPQSGNSFGQSQQRIERAAGSGFVIDTQHQILTNFHVVSDALKSNSTDLKQNASINVQFPGGNPLSVKVVGVNQSYDLALLQLKHPSKAPHDAIPIPLANSNHVQVGEKAIAIGNPFTLQSTVTQGIVSATNRDQAALVSGVPIPYIQTDAAINPGNSGGPLLNSKGQAIGVNDEILAPNGTFIGVGFAIPSNIVRQSLPQIKAGGFIKKAMIGVLVESLDNYPKHVRQELNLPDHGLMIVKVKPHSPGAKAGLTGSQMTVNAEGTKWPVGGDIILKANGRKITHARTLQKLVFSKHAGDKISLVILHDGHRKTVTVTLAVLKSQSSNSS